MAIHDISMAIHDNMMVYKNKKEKQPKRKITHEYLRNGVNESKITMGLHTGTHIDAHLHMSENGDTIENIDLNKLIHKARVLDFTDLNDCIMADDLRKKEIEKGSFLLFKTKNSMVDYFKKDFIYLEKSGAEYLRDMGVIGAGTDSLGIERSQPGHPTHKILMESGIIIIEGLRLKDINEGDYMMYALPLKIQGGDGGPARVVIEDL